MESYRERRDRGVEEAGKRGKGVVKGKLERAEGSERKGGEDVGRREDGRDKEEGIRRKGEGI